MKTSVDQNWLQENFPHIVKAFERSQVNFDSIKPGDTLLTLHGGFNSYTGGNLVRVVKTQCLDHRNQKHIEVIPLNQAADGHVCLVYESVKEPWFLTVKLMTPEEAEAYKNLNVHQQRQWQHKNLAMTLD